MTRSPWCQQLTDSSFLGDFTDQRSCLARDRRTPNSSYVYCRHWIHDYLAPLLQLGVSISPLNWIDLTRWHSAVQICPVAAFPLCRPKIIVSSITQILAECQHGSLTTLFQNPTEHSSLPVRRRKKPSHLSLELTAKQMFPSCDTLKLYFGCYAFRKKEMCHEARANLALFNSFRSSDYVAAQRLK